MSRTQEQIKERLRELYSAVWCIDTLDQGLAIWEGMSKVYSDLETTVDSLIASTYVLQANGNQVDLHAKGRGLVRGTAESDEKLKIRIRSWEDKLTKPALEAGMNALLENGGAYIEENLPDGGFYDRQVTFYNRGYHWYGDKYFYFSAWVPFQVSSLLLNAFYDRQVSFYDRQNAFYEDLDNPDPSIYKRIYDYLNENRAAGVRFDLFIF